MKKHLVAPHKHWDHGASKISTRRLQSAFEILLAPQLQWWDWVIDVQGESGNACVPEIQEDKLKVQTMQKKASRPSGKRTFLAALL